MNDDKKYPSDLQDRFQLRLPVGMRDQIKEMADRSGRSMNAEIVHRLIESIEMTANFEKRKQLDFSDEFTNQRSNTHAHEEKEEMREMIHKALEMLEVLTARENESK